MKTQFGSLLCLMLLAACSLQAQDVSAVCREQMRTLKFFAGKWKGDAQITQQGGQVVNVSQEESIEFRLDSLLLQMEGTGRRKSEPGKISFHALGFVSYNAVKKNYDMKSFLMDGRQTDAYFKVLEKDKYQWGFDVTGGSIQYTITVDQAAKTWNEKGAFSPDKTNWYPFFEMNLKKIN